MEALKELADEISKITLERDYYKEVAERLAKYDDMLKDIQVGDKRQRTDDSDEEDIADIETPPQLEEVVLESSVEVDLDGCGDSGHWCGQCDCDDSEDEHVAYDEVCENMVCSHCKATYDSEMCECIFCSVCGEVNMTAQDDDYDDCEKCRKNY